jgi:hypothetical protein
VLPALVWLSFAKLSQVRHPVLDAPQFSPVLVPLAQTAREQLRRLVGAHPSAATAVLSEQCRLLRSGAPVELRAMAASWDRTTLRQVHDWDCFVSLLAQLLCACPSPQTPAEYLGYVVTVRSRALSCASHALVTCVCHNPTRTAHARTHSLPCSLS